MVSPPVAVTLKSTDVGNAATAKSTLSRIPAGATSPLPGYARTAVEDGEIEPEDHRVGMAGGNDGGTALFT